MASDSTRRRKRSRWVMYAASAIVLAVGSACSGTLGTKSEGTTPQNGSDPANTDDVVGASGPVDLAALFENLPSPPQPTLPSKDGLWISRAEVQALPMSGAAWDAVKSAADEAAGAPDLSDQNGTNNIHVLAKALVFVRTGEQHYRDEVHDACRKAIGTEKGGRVLALGRKLIAYVIAADLVGLSSSADPTLEADFRAWLKTCLTEPLDGRTLQEIHSTRPNNWGTDAGASRAAVAVFLNDERELSLCAQTFKGWLGDTATYPGAKNLAEGRGFKFGSDLSWQGNPKDPRGVNPPGSTTADGHSLDGALPDDMRRGAKVQFPPAYTNYPWGAMQGATVIAEILTRRGYDAWNWENQALLRAAKFLRALSTSYNPEWWAHGDDEWIVDLLNRRYQAGYEAGDPNRSGKNVGFTSWTHALVR